MLSSSQTSSKEQEVIAQQTSVLQEKDAIIKAKDEQIVQLKEAYDFLQTQVDALRRMVFGSKSERYLDPENKQPSLLDNHDFAAVDKEGAQLPLTEVTVAAHTRKKKPKSDKNLPRRIELIKIPEAQMRCNCGACKEVIKTEVKELINYIPAVFEIIEQHREVAACPICREGVVTAPAPLHVLPKVGASESFLAHIIVSKFEDRQPLYHLESKLALYDVECSRQNMARWVIDCTEPLQPIYNLLKEVIIEHDIASCDATSLQVLKEAGRSAQTKSDVYCFTGGPPEKPVVLYAYNANQHKKFIDNWFNGFKGTLHVDADNVFDLVASNNALLSYCNAHARRKFEPIAKATKGHGIAKQAMQYYKKLYQIEREAKDKGLSHAERYALRQEKSKPIAKELNDWLDKVQPTVLPKSPLGKAVAYAIRHRTGLMRFLDDGRLEIDNNHTERLIKPLVIARKNFMFCNSVAGANALCMHFSLIQTAKLHGLNPYEYYVSLLKSIPYCKTVEDYEQLLPWNMAAKSQELPQN